jgi:hypothetical protein
MSRFVQQRSAFGQTSFPHNGTNVFVCLSIASDPQGISHPPQHISNDINYLDTAPAVTGPMSLHLTPRTLLINVNFKSEVKGSPLLLLLDLLKQSPTFHHRSPLWP